MIAHTSETATQSHPKAHRQPIDLHPFLHESKKRLLCTSGQNDQDQFLPKAPKTNFTQFQTSALNTARATRRGFRDDHEFLVGTSNDFVVDFQDCLLHSGSQRLRMVRINRDVIIACTISESIHLYRLVSREFREHYRGECSTRKILNV